MPVLMSCPHSGCTHPGPLGFIDPHPWGTMFYHGGDCGEPICRTWNYEDQWYDTEEAAWKQYKKDNPHLNELWVKAYDALIIKKSERSYKYWIHKWDEKQQEFLQTQFRRQE